jgi:predicted O-methyltransferase YrrM
MPKKAESGDFQGRFREIMSDPLNVLIERHPLAGQVTEDGACVYLHNGNLVPRSGSFAYYSEFSDILVINSGVHEPLEEFVFQQLLEVLPETPLMIELGAYWGHYSMWLKKIKPESEVILVEADPHNLEVGRQNFERNGLTGSFIAGEVRQGGFSVSYFVEQRKLRRIDLLHADIQGFELEMIEDCVPLLREQRIDYMLISTHSQEIHEQIERILAHVSYNIIVSSDYDSHTTSHDGLIFASAPDLPNFLAGFVPVGRSELTRLSGQQKVEYLSRASDACQTFVESERSGLFR